MPCTMKPSAWPAACSQVTTSARFCTRPVETASTRASARRSRMSMGTASPSRFNVARCLMCQFGSRTRRRRAESRGSAQANRLFRRSSIASHARRLSGPGGSGLKLRISPSDRVTQRGTSTLSSSRPTCVCVVARTGGLHVSGMPAKATSFQSASARSTAPLWAGSPALNLSTSMSPGAKVSTPDRYFSLPGAARMAARASAGSPTRISGMGSRCRICCMPRAPVLSTPGAHM